VGRILVAQTITHHLARGNPLRVSVSTYKHVVDHAVNRLIKYAIWLLTVRYSRLQQRKGAYRIRAELNRLYRSFRSVYLDKQKVFLTDRIVRNPAEIPYVRAYYAPAIEIARMLIYGHGVDLTSRSGPVTMEAMLVNMEDVFESYLRNVLVDLSPSSFRVLNGNRGGEDGARVPLFDSAPGGPSATPDVLLSARQPSLAASLVVEVKYKEVEDAPDRADINQAITYAVRYNAKTVVIAHPSTPKGVKHMRHLGDIHNFQVYQYGFDLGGDLAREEADFAHAIFRLGES
jgi:5-methylcytosine-specific restriction enzyme subunit McrC